MQENNFYVADLELLDLCEFCRDDSDDGEIIHTLTAGRLQSEQGDELTH